MVALMKSLIVEDSEQNDENQECNWIKTMLKLQWK